MHFEDLFWTDVKKHLSVKKILRKTKNASLRREVFDETRLSGAKIARNHCFSILADFVFLTSTIAYWRFPVLTDLVCLTETEVSLCFSVKTETSKA